MTSSNIVDVSRQNGHADARDKTPEEIQLEIAQTRSIITDDLLALSEKLSPQHLRENAREMMRDARDEAKELLRDAKDAAIGSLRDMKHRAVERVSQQVHDLGDQARHASDATLSFVSANAVAMSLVGLGAGLLLMTLRARQRLSSGTGASGRTYRYEQYAYPDAEEVLPGEEPSTLRDSAIDRADEAPHALAYARGAALRDEARELTHRAQRAARRTREIAADNKLAVVAVTVMAGLGIGLLLPIGRRPRAALQHAGERMWDGAQRVGHDLSARAHQWR